MATPLNGPSRAGTAGYNDIARWNLTEPPSAFGARDAVVQQVSTLAELDDALKDSNQLSGHMCFIEVALDQHDMPPNDSSTVTEVTTAPELSRHSAWTRELVTPELAVESEKLGLAWSTMAAPETSPAASTNTSSRPHFFALEHASVSHPIKLGS
jgi:hypothetical protein